MRSTKPAKKIERASESSVQISGQTFDRIVQAIRNSGVSGVAALEGARLTETWIRETEKFDKQFPTVAAELPFFMILEKYTIVVGMMDRIAKGGPGGLFGSEWKTTKGTTRFWNEEKWKDGIKNGTQISIYGLALYEGTFTTARDFISTPPGGGEIFSQSTEEGKRLMWSPRVARPHMLVRAITKENPAQLWGVDPPAFFEIPQKRLDTMRESLALRADQIRVARKRKSIPWAVPGLHCMDRFHFGEKCRFYEPYCSKGKHPESVEIKQFNDDDPGSAGLKAARSVLNVELTDPKIVVLSASAYSDYEDCPESFRLTTIEGSETSSELDKGTAFHAGIAEWYGGRE